MIDCVKLQPHLFVFNSAIIWVFFALFGPFGAIFRVGVRFKNFLGPTYVDNQLLVFEVQPYLFLLVLVTFGASFVLFGTFMAIFGSFGLFLGSGSDSKTIFGTYLCSQSTLVLEVQTYPFAFISAKFGAFFALFGPFKAIFGVGVKLKNFFGDLLT